MSHFPVRIEGLGWCELESLLAFLNRGAWSQRAEASSRSPCLTHTALWWEAWGDLKPSTSGLQRTAEQVSWVPASLGAALHVCLEARETAEEA